jgi:hypothetical protein
VRRPCTISVIALLGLGAVAVSIHLGQVLAQGAAQQPPVPDELAQPAEEAEPRLRGVKRRTEIRREPLEAIPSGAGTTGFVSTRKQRPARERSAARRNPAGAPLATVVRPGSGPAPAAPLSLTPTLGPSASPASSAGLPAAPGLSAGVPPPTQPPLRRRRPAVEEDPFDPIGVRVGSWLVRPAIEVMAGHDTNPSRSRGGRSSPVVIVSPDIEMRSDWRRHEGFAILRGAYTTYERAPELDRPNLELRAGGRVDITSNSRVDLEGRYLVSTENPGSPDLPADLAKLPKVQTFGGTVTLAQRFNRLELALKGSVDRVTYEDSLLTDGTIVDNESRQYNQYATALRASYDLSPGMRPFAELGVDTRKHDVDIDLFGFRRNSNGIIPKVGTTFELADNLTGEGSIGYLVREYEDERLEDLRGLIADVSLIWRASALTTVKATALSIADETTVPGVSGILRRDFGVQVDHAFRRWLIGTVKLAYGTDDYQGGEREDDRYAASVGLTYKATRSIHVKGELRQDWLRSNIPGVDYTATVALAGMRFQR